MLGRLFRDVVRQFRPAGVDRARAARCVSEGGARHRAGDLREAEQLYAQAIAAQPDCVEAHVGMANLLQETRRPQKAQACMERALALAPDSHEAWYGLGNIRLALGELEGAAEAYRQALALKPDLAEAHNNLGMVLHRNERHDEARAAFRRALEVRPDFSDAHSNLILGMMYDPRCDLARHHAERRRWQEQHVERAGIRQLSHANAADPERKLRVGYVSADFRRHSAICGFGPMLLDYDRAGFEVILYSNSRKEDDFTARFRQSADRWRNITGVPDAAAAAQIQEDAVDILVDLSGHSADNRLLVFARKPAPVQVSAWGFVTGTGLEAMDYLFADALMIPPASERWYSEKIVHLPCALTFMPQGDPPPVTPLPAQRNGYPTYGYFNTYVKLSTPMLELWARLLAAVPDSRMLFKGSQSASTRERVLGIFGRAGVGAERVLFSGATPWREHMVALGEVDVALDPFPQGGGISTLEALWMGVPVVTLRGETVPSRASSAILSLAGLQDWVAEDAEQYHAIAARAAQDIAALGRLREGLRARAQAAPFGDVPAYVRAVEATYRALWRQWCRERESGSASADEK